MVFVYFNLHKKLFSVKALHGLNKGRVIAHMDNIFLSDVSFKVSEAGRQRVLREKRKNVHAGVVGNWECEFLENMEGGVDITYNPYKFDSFVRADNHEPVRTARAVCLTTGRGRLNGKRRIVAFGINENKGV